MKSVPLNLSIVLAYIIVVTSAGIAFGRRQSSVRGYFLGDRSLPWFAVCLSIVATETSTLTFISIPGLAYLTDMTFLQLAFGYIVGRLIIAVTLLPAYFQGECFTSYQLLYHRYGRGVQKFSSLIFLGTRTLADGVRLFATAIPLALVTGWDETVCILLIAVCTILYTYLGGIKSVIWMDVIQSFTYVSGALVAIVLLWTSLPEGGLAHLPQQKWRIFQLGFGGSFWQLNYTVLSGLIGGAFLSMASHGTDQLIVQRLLSCRDLRSGQKALIVSGVLIFLQFALFLFLGLMLFLHFGGAAMRSDEVLPRFVAEDLPPLLSGLLIASIFAAAMSTLSSSLNSLASSTLFDLIRRDQSLPFSRLATLLWGVILVVAALFFRKGDQPVVELGLGIASFTYGAVLGVYTLSLMKVKPSQGTALCSMWGALFFLIPLSGQAGWIAAILACIEILAGVWIVRQQRQRRLRAFMVGWTFLMVFWLMTGVSPEIAWTWFVPAGTAVTILLGSLLNRPQS